MANEDGSHDIEFTIPTDGSVAFKVKGMKGGKCVDVANAIRKATGFKVARVEKTGEAYEASCATSGTISVGASCKLGDD